MKICGYCGHVMDKKHDICTVCGNATYKYICACCEKELPEGKNNYCGKCKLDKNHVAKAAVVYARRQAVGVKQDFGNVVDKVKDIPDSIVDMGADALQKAREVVLESDFPDKAKKIVEDVNRLMDSVDCLSQDLKDIIKK